MENCEVLRETNSKRLLYRTMDERTAQASIMMRAVCAQLRDSHCPMVP